jgi:predicted nuclease of predicted toxin-antitoxin system
MAKQKLTVFQKLDKAISGDWGLPQSHNNTYDFSASNGDNVIYKTDNKEDYLKTKKELQQNAYLNQRWLKANSDLSVQAFAGLNNIKLMYRDADLMDSFPEIGAALDILAEESCINNSKNQLLNIYSSSDRIKNVLEELFINRLDIQVTAPMLIRGMCKYGNQFMLLNINNKLGVTGWRQLPVYSMERLENGVSNPYSSINNSSENSEDDMKTKFVWVGENNSQVPFRNWQIAHFRLLTDSLYLPYGMSYLHKARRHWRMLSLMEDMMLIYRLERSIERRVYKIYVGAIDDADVQSYVQEIANNFKRTPIIDPMTGQVDLRKNLLSVDQDIFIPVRDQNAPTPIDTLAAAQNLTAMDDIKFVQNKLFTALGIPKTFLNYEEGAGDGKNLALMDIRFTRRVNRIQQAFLMEMTKVATIHLYLLGFHDELTNFSLSMNNPSTQAEQLEIENIQKKIGAMRDAVADPGNGIPIMSATRALKEIMKWSDKDIQSNLEEIRLEKALAAELEKTTQIIKKTGLFDNVDRIYGEPGAEYQDQQPQEGGGDDMGGPPMGGGGGPMDMGGDMPMDDNGMGEEVDALGDVGADENGEIAGAEGEIPMESKRNKGSLLTENGKINTNFFLKEAQTKNKAVFERMPILDKALIINEEFDRMIKSLNDIKE